MSFTYPLGLLGLIGIPILIIIYIIKNKYTEQIIATTYLWTLSEKFLKKKKPISLINGLISLLLQILIVLVISLLIAHPIITIPSSAKEYCFILDGSGSMNTVDEELSRFELGKQKINKLIQSSTDGSKYTLVYVSDSPRVVYEKITSKDKANELLTQLQPTGVNIDYESTLVYVQDYFNTNTSLVTYLITDKDYSSNNINVINVADDENNYYIANFDYKIEGLKLIISGNIISNFNQTVELEIYMDEQIVNKQEIVLQENSENNFEYISTVVDFASITATIITKDSLILDNSKTIYNIEKNHDYSTLIISDRPYYLQSIIKTIGNISITTVSRDDYNNHGNTMTGYSLYIFDSFTPNTLPDDGTIWLFSPSDSIEGSGFSLQDVCEDEKGMVLTYPNNSTSIFKTLTSGLEKEDIYVSKYYKYGLYRNFTTLLTHNGNPVVFTGSADNGCREVVFAFDIHDSNVAMLMDFILLTKNLLTYSFPVIIEETSYVCGDSVKINVLSNCKSIRIDSPNGNVSYLDVSSEVAQFNTNEVGTYKITLSLGTKDDTSLKEMFIYTSLPEEESINSTEQLEMSLNGELMNDYTDGIYNKLWALFVILVIVYIADWMVYCYEQYQLR